MLHLYKGTIKDQRRKKRHIRVRSKISGTAIRPRVTVSRSIKYIYLQAIDDINGVTLIGLHEKSVENLPNKQTKKQRAELLGKEFGKRLLDKDITEVVFDRAGYAYHGRVKAVADGLRSSGLHL